MKVVTYWWGRRRRRGWLFKVLVLAVNCRATYHSLAEAEAVEEVEEAAAVHVVSTRC
jgi:hypothetical protein